MKRVIFSTLVFLGIASFASAQTSSGNSSTTTGAVSSTSHNAKSSKSKKPSEKLNNRRIYQFKNGQRSTPTGNEATGVGGGFAALGKNDSAAQQSDTIAVNTSSQTRAKKTTTNSSKSKARKTSGNRKTSTARSGKSNG
jgi:hypothetical protein